MPLLICTNGAALLVLGTTLLHCVMSMPSVLSLAVCMMARNSASESCDGKYACAAWASLQLRPCEAHTVSQSRPSPPQKKPAVGGAAGGGGLGGGGVGGGDGGSGLQKQRLSTSSQTSPVLVEYAV